MIPNHFSSKNDIHFTEWRIVNIKQTDQHRCSQIAWPRYIECYADQSLQRKCEKLSARECHIRRPQTGLPDNDARWFCCFVLLEILYNVRHCIFWAIPFNFLYKNMPLILIFSTGPPAAIFLWADIHYTSNTGHVVTCRRPCPEFGLRTGDARWLYCFALLLSALLRFFCKTTDPTFYIVRDESVVKATPQVWHGGMKSKNPNKLKVKIGSLVNTGDKAMRTIVTLDNFIKEMKQLGQLFHLSVVNKSL